MDGTFIVTVSFEAFAVESDGDRGCGRARTRTRTRIKTRSQVKIQTKTQTETETKTPPLWLFREPCQIPELALDYRSIISITETLLAMHNPNNDQDDGAEMATGLSQLLKAAAGQDRIDRESLRGFVQSSLGNSSLSL